MTNVIPYEAEVPAHIAKMFGEQSDNSDLSSGVSAGYPIVSYKGKVWHVNQGGNSTLIADANGDPKPSIEVVILKANPNISKIYYAGGYEEGSTAKPTCYSNDGVVPAGDVVDRQAQQCAVCPRNQWGSRITESSAKGKECSDSRRLAVSPSGDLENPMLLRVPAATLKELLTYADMLNRRRTPYQAVVTKIGFDHTVAHPKFTFKAVRWLDVPEMAKVGEVMKQEVVSQIVGQPAPMARVTAPVHNDLDDLPPRPSHIPDATPEPKKAKPEEVHVISNGFGGETEEVQETKADKPKSKASVLIASADQTLDSVLSELDGFDD